MNAGGPGWIPQEPPRVEPVHGARYHPEPKLKIKVNLWKRLTLNLSQEAIIPLCLYLLTIIVNNLLPFV